MVIKKVSLICLLLIQTRVNRMRLEEILFNLGGVISFFISFALKLTFLDQPLMTILTVA